MTNLAGHDMESVLEAFHSVDSDAPTCFIAYTIKGYGLPFAGHKDNHSGLMSLEQMEVYRQTQGSRRARSTTRSPAWTSPRKGSGVSSQQVPFAARDERAARSNPSRRCRRC